ncbi:MAG: hypothetical protein LJF04_09980, partial [Gemmatimonadetes bacterium]|nr:hypothetical protein [Gemmatimonadota bacterium]
SDRVDLLEAGADDCLSGGVDIPELGARIRQAVESGGKPAPKGEREKHMPLKGGLVDPVAFDAEVRARLDDPWKSVLTILKVTEDANESSRLKGFLLAEIRAEQGDLVTVTTMGTVVLLQGARRDAAGAFVARVRQRLESEGKGAASVRWDVLSHQGNRQGILDLTASLMAAGTSAPPSDSGGILGSEG